MQNTVRRVRPARRGAAGAGERESTIDWKAVGGRVKALRQEQRIKASTVAEALNLDAPKMSKIESGERKIQPSELARLARTLNVSPTYLLQGPQEPTFALAARLAEGENLTSLRTRAVDVYRVASFLSTVGEVKEQRPSAAGAAAAAAIREEFPNAPRNQDEAERQGRKAALLVRKHLRNELGPIQNLADFIEMNFGADVVLVPIPEASGGLCARDGNDAVIVASSAATFGRVRFTLAHELGHLLFEDMSFVIDEQRRSGEPRSLTDRRVDAFAAELLLPEEALRGYLQWRGALAQEHFDDGRLGAQAVAGLADKFGLSVQATAVALAKLNLAKSSTELKAAVHALPSSARQGRYTSEDISNEVRSPERLLDAATLAAANRKSGLGPLTVLLCREDQEALFAEYVAVQPPDERNSASE